jgi:uncharacterized phage infection (PIP) family protein YhgE
VFISEGEKALPRLSIPERFRVGIAALAALPEESFSELLKAIKGKVSADTPELAASQLATRLPSIPQSNLVKMISAIASLQSLDSRSHVRTSTLAADISDSLSSDSPELAKGISSEVLKSRVELVVEAEGIHITSAKISELQTEVERSFCRARILTDVRTAFSDDASELPRGMTILHTLQIGYHDGTGRHKEFFVTLESDDLADIKEAIERAEKKKKTLEELLAKADCRLFE